MFGWVILIDHLDGSLVVNEHLGCGLAGITKLMQNCPQVLDGLHSGDSADELCLGATGCNSGSQLGVVCYCTTSIRDDVSGHGTMVCGSCMSSINASVQLEWIMLWEWWQIGINNYWLEGPNGQVDTWLLLPASK